MKDEQIRWYNTKAFVIIAIFLFWPLGFYGLIKSKSIGGMGKTLLFLVGIPWAFIISIAVFMPNEAQTEAAPVVTEVIEPEVKEPEPQPEPVELTPTEKLRGKIENQFSAWDGSNTALVRVIKKSMNDAKSFEHVETLFFPISEGEGFSDEVYGIKMDFRGSNQFGALVLSTVYATADIETGEILTAEMEE